MKKPATQPGGRHKRLLHTVHPGNGGLVFADADRAAFVSRIARAMETSATWAEFRHRMPRSEYSKVLRIIEECGEPRPKGTDSFSAESVPGFCDGDYPPWLQPEMDYLLPEKILSRFGERTDTVLNGAYWHLDPEDLAEIAATLMQHGYQVEDGSHLDF